MRKIGADKIYTDFCLSINLIEKNNKRSCFSKTLAFNSEASKQVAAINKELCNYSGSPTWISNQKRLSQSKLMRLILVVDISEID